MKRSLSILLALVMAFTMCSSTAFASDKNAKASYSKTETVYGKLNYDGSAKSLEIVNRFEVSKGGKITDYGDYSKLTNLTDKILLSQEGNRISFTTNKEDFYYQGKTTTMELPWTYQILYSLDGTTVSPEDLAGASGHLKISIRVKQNPDCTDTSFWKNYLTQVSVTLPEDKTKKVRAHGGSIAESGQDQQASFTVLPEDEGDFYVSAYIEDFEMDGISIAAVPYSMSIDESDLGTDDLTSGFEPLITATNKLSKGASQLANGLDTLAENGDAFTLGLYNLEDGLAAMGEGFVAAYDALDTAISGVPQDEDLPTDSELEALNQVVQDSGNEEAQSALEKLLACYQSLLVVKGTYDQIKPAFEAVAAALNAETGSVVLGVRALGDAMGQYVGGIYQSASGTHTYAKGMKSYAKGIRSIPDEMQDKIDEMMDKYNGDDFEPTSFASSKNGTIQSVQFVLTTDEIKLPDKEDNGLKNITKQEKNDGGILGRFKSLFGL